MLRRYFSTLCGLAVALGGSGVAFGQYSSPSTTPYNPYYNGSSSSSSSAAAMNQLALRNAQQLIAQSLQNNSLMNSPPAARIGLGVGDSFSGTKPFSGFSQGPAISPYLNLFRVDQNGFQGFNYSTLVQPQLQQQQVNQQVQRQNMTTNRRIQAIAASEEFNPQGARDVYPTGHQTVFGYYDHFYPQTRSRGKKRAQ